jgi:hypothetical protein
MKTASQKTLTKKLGNIKVSKSSKSYQYTLDVINGAKQIRPVHTSGSGRFTSNLDYTSSTTSLLKELGIEFTLTNDSPRGGLTGNLINITTKIK